MKIEKIEINKLQPASYNPRQISTKQYKDLKESIEKFGVVDPIIINKNMTVIGGHQRLKVCNDLKHTEIDCVVLDLTKEEERELNIRLNKSGGEFDMDILANEFDVEELKEWGFKEIELGLNIDKIGGNIEDDHIPEVKESRVKLGDVWELGKHRLMCGDSTKESDVAKLMNGQKADVAHNDPPYGMKKEKEGVINDNLNFNDLLIFNREWISLQFTFLKDNGGWYCWGIDEPLMDIYSNILKPFIKEQKATFRNLITWDKGHGQSQNSDLTRSYATADEKCLFIMLGVQGFNNNSDNYFEGFESIRSWLIKEKEKSGLNNKKLRELTTSTHTHYWSKSQWVFPTKEHYNTIKQASNGKAFNKEYEELKKEYEELKKEYEELKKEYYSTRAYFNNTHDNFNNVWHFERHIRQGNEGGHATPKPIPLCERVVKSSCPPKGLVVDFFLGSGSTLIACEKTNRVCYGMELDTKYCDVIIERWQQFTNQKAIKCGV
jgi:DNA modification methylase